MGNKNFSSNKNSVVVGGNNNGNIDNFFTKNTGISVYDMDNEVTVYKVKEMLIFREDARTSAGYENSPILAAKEMFMFANIDYDEILEAEYIQEEENDPVFLKVKFTEKQMNVKRTKDGRMATLWDDEGYVGTKKL